MGGAPLSLPVSNPRHRVLRDDKGRFPLDVAGLTRCFSTMVVDSMASRDSAGLKSQTEG